MTILDNDGIPLRIPSLPFEHPPFFTSCLRQERGKKSVLA
jgi:hypothetical protein